MINTLITADDFGFTDNINRGIIDAYDKGRVTELSLMVDCYGTADAVNYIKRNKVKDVGLHFSLCRIAKDGKLLRGEDYDNILVDWSGDKLAEAFDEEIKLFEDLVGFTPSHVIGHKQISLNRKIVEHVGAYCVTNNCYARRGERSKALSHATLKADEVPEGLNIGRVADAIFGFNYGSPKDMCLAYKSDIENARKTKELNTIEIFFHPGYRDETDKPYTNLIQQRIDDTNFLLSDQFDRLVKEENLQLVTSKDI